MPDTTAIAPTGDLKIDGLLQPAKWASPALTYSFPQAIAAYSDGYGGGSEPYSNFEPLTQAAAAAVRQILASYAAVSGLNFTEQTGAGAGGATLRFGMTDAVKEGFPAYGYGPFTGASGGDTWYRNTGGSFDNPLVGAISFHTYIHEIGHAVGLKHGHDFTGAGAIPPEYNSMEYSVMTYRSYPGQGLPDAGVYTNETFGYAQSLMMLDIAALQHMYGANYASNATDTVYRWDPNTGEMFVNKAGQGAPGANRIFLTVWDGGGSDTYDLSAYSGAVTIDLRPGEWTLTSPVQRANLGDGFMARGNIANALLHKGDARSLIENAKGGTGNDSLTGNDAANRLDGGAGADSMAGGKGNDSYVVDNVLDKVAEAGGNGTDTVESSVTFALGPALENLVLTSSGAIDGTGNNTANAITGNAGANVLDGGAGADKLGGGAGNDTYVVDQSGDQVMETSAGGGTDLVRSAVSYTLGDHLENLVLVGTGPIDGTGNALDNRISGDSGANVLTGHDGNDRLSGGAGDDRLDGGPGTDTADYSGSAAAIAVNLAVTAAQATGGAGLDILAGVENLVGSKYADRLDGSTVANLLDGGNGADTMRGGDGNDVYIVDNARDLVVEASGGGSDTVRSEVSYTLGAYVETLVLIGTRAISGTGNGLGNAITGNGAANVLNGGYGADRLTGGAGDDTYVVDNLRDVLIESGSGVDTVDSSVTWTLGELFENLTLTGTAGRNATGNAGANRLTGNPGNNVLDGRAGADWLSGGAGNDTYIIDDVGDVIDNAGEDASLGGSGTDKVLSSITYYLDTNIENLTLTGAGAISGGGNYRANVIVGNAAANDLDGAAGDDFLDGAAGADVMRGSLGADTYIVDNVGDQVVEDFGGAVEIDTVRSSVTFSIESSQGVENLVLVGLAAIDGTGNFQANRISGNSAVNKLNGGDGDDILDGGGAADTMTGGIGADTFIVDHGADKIVELAGQGQDIAFASVSYTLPANVEHLTLTGSADLSGRGNAESNLITGNAGLNTLTGGAGNDVYVIQNAGDKVVEAANAGSDRIKSSISFVLPAEVEVLELTGTGNINGTGNSGNNTVLGNSGNNVLDGGGGSDQLFGGEGSDTYIVSTGSGTLNDSGTTGTDTVRFTGVYAYFAGDTTIENFVIDGIDATTLFANDLANVVTGNAAANVIQGMGGADTLRGGAGDDSYYVEQAGDKVVEKASEGFDTLYSGVDYTLAANVEKLVLLDGALNGTGNNGANTIVGNSGYNRLIGGDGNDVLDGGTGYDTLEGGAGADSYYVSYDAGLANDLIIDTGGTDRVYVRSGSYSLEGTSVEHLTLLAGATSGSGNALNNSLRGNDGANSLHGLDGADSLYGGMGADTLSGGTGADGFYFESLNGIDYLADFEAADTIYLSRAVFSGIAANGTLSAAAFRIGTAAQDATDRIIYNPDLGRILYDADGAGGVGAIWFATVAAGKVLTNLDFSAYTPG
ncbi:MAG TPA: M10 family metallopeptidase [Allosphingosinicella sp.]